MGNIDMRVKSVVAFSTLLVTACLEPASFALAAPECSMSATLVKFGEKSIAHMQMAPKETCQFALKLSGTVQSSQISIKPGRGKLKKVDTSTYQYTAKGKGADTFAITATGKSDAASQTSELSFEVTIK